MGTLSDYAPQGNLTVNNFDLPPTLFNEYVSAGGKTLNYQQASFQQEDSRLRRKPELLEDLDAIDIEGPDEEIDVFNQIHSGPAFEPLRQIQDPDFRPIQQFIQPMFQFGRSGTVYR